MKATKIILEIIGWCQIAFGTTLLFALIAAALYFAYTSNTTAIIAIALIIAGFIVGVIWATRIWIKHGTIEWLSRIRRIK
ncbi:MAG: hypothetical protein HYR66_19275 [Sphingobacteriales bacterium]|nr:hypothetical protein [Sphingobacteriales bacterium]MBI3718892.1 hypothetical protein [Sphingobacteriales bacterium]